MILDSSAIVAITLGELTEPELTAKVENALAVRVGGPTLFETRLVLVSRRGHDALTRLDFLLQEFSAEIVAFDRDHAIAASDAFERYGKGRHPAGLNYGDCMA